MSPIESIVQHRLATPKPLKTRRVLDRCVIVPLRKPVCLMVSAGVGDIEPASNTSASLKPFERIFPNCRDVGG